MEELFLSLSVLGLKTESADGMQAVRAHVDAAIATVLPGDGAQTLSVPAATSPAITAATRGALLAAIVGLGYGDAIVMGGHGRIDQCFLAFRNDAAAVVLSRAKHAASVYGRFMPRLPDGPFGTEVHTLYGEAIPDLAAILDVAGRVVVVVVDELAEPPARWLQHLRRPPEAVILMGSGAGFERLGVADAGSFRTARWNPMGNPAEEPDGLHVAVGPANALRTLRDPTPRPEAPHRPPSPGRHLPAGLPTVYRFPDRTRLLELADGAVLLSPEAVSRIRPPVYSTGRVPDRSLYVNAHNTSQILAPRYALEFHNLRIVGDGILITRDGHFFDGYYLERRLSKYLESFAHTYWNVRMTRSSDGVRCPRSETVDQFVRGRNVIVPAPSAVFELFAHFTLDFFPRFAEARRLLEDAEYIYVSSHIRPRHLAAICSLFDIPETRIRTYDRNGNAWLFEDAVVVPGMWLLESLGPPHLDAYAQVKSRVSFPAGEDPAAWKRIFPSRLDNLFTNSRMLVNTDEVVTTLARRGFREYTPSSFSFAEQIAIFDNADFIIGELGSTTQPFGAIRPGINVGWLCGEYAITNYGYLMSMQSSLMQANYAIVAGQQFGAAYNTHFWIDPTELNHSLDALGA